MRVEGQGNAVDHSAKVQTGKSVAEKGDAGASKIRTIVENPAPVNEVNKETGQKQDVVEAAKILNEAMNMANCHLEFQAYEDSGKFQVQVVDNRTRSVIKEIPPDYMLELAGRFREMLDTVVGLFVNEIV